MTSSSEALPVRIKQLTRRVVALTLALCALPAAAGTRPDSSPALAGNSHHVAGHAASHETRRAAVPFTEATWPRLLAQGPRPAAYLFTTSYCSTCPAAFEVLDKAARASKLKPRLAAVVMDIDGRQAQAHAAHFKGMTDLYVFEGFEPAIRQVVDPKWPNVTPYVVLIDPKGGVQRVIGPPEPAMLKAWLDKTVK